MIRRVSSSLRFLSDDQPVFGLEGQGGERPRAYPQLVLVWHEIVNDRVNGRPLTVTYCPLTGTAIAFTGPPDGAALTFGTTGNLVNSNLVMYDRQTDSTWPQLTGTAITGKRKGQTLATTPLLWTTWKNWRSAHPRTRALSTDTGHLRDYGSDPYGSYTRRSGYYTEGGPLFPVLATTAHLGRGAAGRRRSGRRRRRCAARAPALGSHVRRVRRVVLTPRELVVLADPVHADRTGGRHGVDTYSVPRARIEQVRADGPLLRIRVCEADLQLPLGEELSARVVHAFARHLPIAP
jgi:hypothetical protein